MLGLGSLRDSLCFNDLNMLPCFSKEDIEDFFDKLPAGGSKVPVAMLAVCRLMWVAGKEASTSHWTSAEREGQTSEW